MTIIDDIFDDYGAENSLPTPRYPIQPEERCWSGLPIRKDFALNKPGTGSEIALFKSLVIIR